MQLRVQLKNAAADEFNAAEVQSLVEQHEDSKAAAVEWQEAVQRQAAMRMAQDKYRYVVTR
jgi:adenylate kinase